MSLHQSQQKVLNYKYSQISQNQMKTLPKAILSNPVKTDADRSRMELSRFYTSYHYDHLLSQLHLIQAGTPLNDQI